MCLWAERSCFQNLSKFELLQNRDWKDLSAICKSRPSSELTQRNRPRDLILKITAKYKFNVNVQMSVWDSTVCVFLKCSAAVIYCRAATTMQQFQHFVLLYVRLTARCYVIFHVLNHSFTFVSCCWERPDLVSKPDILPRCFSHSRSLHAALPSLSWQLNAEAARRPVKKPPGSGFSTLKITDLKYFPLTRGPLAH